MAKAVIITNMGGPDSIESIEPFLFNLFSDPEIIDIPMPGLLKGKFVKGIVKKRLPKSKEIYKYLGGSSPLLNITKNQAYELERILNSKDKGNFKVYTAMRYWHPLFEDVWKMINPDNYEKIIILPMYPHYSTTTTGSLIAYLKNFINKELAQSKKLKFINSYCDHSAFIGACVVKIKYYLTEYLISKKPIDLLMSAHSIPMKRVKQGDPYPNEINRCVDAIKSELPENIQVHLAYQSRVGPVQWLGPDIQEILKTLALNDKKTVFVYPISFVADNSETLYEIEVQYKKLAKQLGITNFNRINALNTEPEFIKAMAQIVEENC